MSKIPHDPSRFQNFNELPDGKGFKLADGKIFFYDKFGGWFDEYKNYYNSNGEPCDPPRPEDFYEYDEKEFDPEYEDDLLNEYDEGGEANDEYDEFYNNFKHQQKHDRLEKHVNSYPNGHEITIEFSNMNFKANKQELSMFFLHDYPKNNSSPIKQLIIDFKENNSYFKTGTGRLITNDKNFALFCVKKDSMDLLGRPLYLEIAGFVSESESEEEVEVVKKSAENEKKESENEKKAEEKVNVPTGGLKLQSKEFNPIPPQQIANEEKNKVVNPPVEEKKEVVEKKKEENIISNPLKQQEEKTEAEKIAEKPITQVEKKENEDAWDKPLPKVSRSKPEEKNVASKPKYKKKS